MLVVGFRIDDADIVRRIQVIAVGAIVGFLGVIVLIATFARPLAKFIGYPLSRSTVTGRLARGNAMRNPRRTAATASALVVGLEPRVPRRDLLGVDEGVDRAGDRGGREGRLRAERGPAAAVLAPAGRGRRRSLPAVAAATPLRLGKVDVGVRDEVIMGVDPDVVDQMLDLDLQEGSIDGVRAGGILLPRNEADRYDVGVGDSVPITFPRTGPRPVTVAGIYDRFQFTGGFPVPLGVMSIQAQEANFGGTQQDSLVYVKAKPGRSRRPAGRCSATCATTSPTSTSAPARASRPSSRTPSTSTSRC